MTTSNQSLTTQTSLTPSQIDEILDGIARGRSLKRIESALGVDAGAFLRLTQVDEDIAIKFREARELSTYAIESDIDELVRANDENPVNAAKNAALKLRVDYLTRLLEARNPEVFSGKAPISSTVPIKITTLLDLGGPRQIEGVYALTAEVTKEIDASQVPSNSEFTVVGVRGDAPPGTGGSIEAPLDLAAAEAGRATAQEVQFGDPEASFGVEEAPWLDGQANNQRPRGPVEGATPRKSKGRKPKGSKTSK